MTRPDPYVAKFLLGFIGDNDRGLDIPARARDLGCEPTLAAVTAALREIACEDCEPPRECQVCRTLRDEDEARRRERAS
jgi:hypothetical protein